MRFLLDAQLPASLCNDLVRRGHEAVHVKKALRKDAPDAELWAFARSTGHVIVTKDEDFAYRIQSGADGPQIVWVRLGNCSNAALKAGLLPLWADVCKALAAGEKIVEVS
jgi:predicted nuclease of predicted toxin-antitoxin system